MSDILSMPNITASDTQGQVSQIKSYLIQLNEQLEFALNKISTDNTSVDNLYNEVNNVANNLAFTSKVVNVVKTSLINKIENVKNNTVKCIDVMYAYNLSCVDPPVNGWTTDAPQWEKDRYIWQKAVTTYADDRVYSSKPVCISGAKGDTGEDGADGVGISSIVEQYYLSYSSATQVGSSWSETVPTWERGKFYFTRSKITWNNNTVTFSNPVLSSGLTAANEFANLAYDQVNSLQVGGRNLLTKSSLTEDYTNGNFTSLTVNKSTIVSDYSIDGQHFTTITNPDGGVSDNGIQIKFDFEQLGFTYGDEITIGLDIKGTSSYKCLVVFYPSSTATSESQWWTATTVRKLVDYTEEKFIRLYYNFKIPTSSEMFANNKILYFSILAGYNGDIYFKNLKIEKGNKATDYTPAPEDVDSNIKNAVDNIQIGGRNLLLGTNGEWNIGTSSSTTALFQTSIPTYSIGITDVFGTNKAVRLLPTAANQYFGSSKCTNNPCKIPNTYTFSFYVKSDSNTTIRICNRVAGGTFDTLKTVNVTTYWQQVFKTFTTTDVITDINVWIYTDGSVPVEVSHLQVELGNKVTDWAPAPEDVDKQIVDTKACIDNIKIDGKNLIINSAGISNPLDESFDDTYKDFVVVGIEQQKIDCKDFNIASFYQQDQVILDNEIYTFSFYARADKETDKLKTYFTPVYDSNSKFINNEHSYQITTDWKRYSAQVNSGELKEDDWTRNLFFRVDPSEDPTNVYICGYKLEIGDKATDWTPAPDDVKKFTQLQKEIDMKKNKIISGSDVVLSEGFETKLTEKENELERKIESRYIAVSDKYAMADDLVNASVAEIRSTTLSQTKTNVDVTCFHQVVVNVDGETKGYVIQPYIKLGLISTDEKANEFYGMKIGQLEGKIKTDDDGNFMLSDDNNYIFDNIESPYSTITTKDGYKIMQGEKPIQWFENEISHTRKMEVQNSLSIGSEGNGYLQFISSQSGGVAVKWSGTLN